MIFISHAAPEDNEFARWLSLRLAGVGFEVWSDVTKLLGGEKFWREIEVAIKEHTAKFLLCVSTSPVRSGVLRELDWAFEAEAATKRDLIVPLKLDSTAFAKFPRDLGSYVNAIRFDHGWAAGLAQVLAMLERDGIKPGNRCGLSVVRDAWARWYPIDEGLANGTDECVSNLFPTTHVPERIWYHPTHRYVRRGFKGDSLRVIAEPYANGFVSFCEPHEMRRAVQRFGIRAQESTAVTWEKFLSEGFTHIALRERTAQRYGTTLLRRAFQRRIEELGLVPYALANKKVCFWLKSGFLVNDEGRFKSGEGKQHTRALVGFKTLIANKEGVRAKRLWHFAVQGLPTFEPHEGMILKTHVVFTPDGQTPYGSDAYQHRARRNQGKNWWNDVWRDRLLAMMGVLAGGGEELAIPVAHGREFRFSALPVRFVTNASYVVTEQQPEDDMPDDDDLLDHDEVDENA